MFVCYSCRAELCYQCAYPDDDSGECCCGGTNGRFPGSTFSKQIIKDPDPFSEEKFTGPEEAFEEDKRGPGRPRLSGDEMVSPLKSGRRRAGLIAKIPEGYICEWAKLESAGGGVVPIIGCAGNPAVALHHGPDKSTLNNEVGINLHRVCVHCHNRWHELNDPFYGPRPADNSEYLPLPENTWEPHNRLDQVSRQEVAASELWWKIPKLERTVKYREWRRTTPVGNRGRTKSDSRENDLEQTG